MYTQTNDPVPENLRPQPSGKEQVAKMSLLEAVDFALDKLEPYEVHSFLSEFRDGADISPWITAWTLDNACEQSDKEVCLHMRSNGEQYVEPEPIPKEIVQSIIGSQ